MRAPFSHALDRGLVRWRDLLAELVRRDLKLRYQRSALGLAWSLLFPLAQLLVFSFIFQRVLPLGIPDYPAFLFSGLLAWNWLQSGLTAGAGAIVDQRDLVKRPGFPLSVLPVVTVTTHGIHYLLALPVLVAYLLTSGIPLSPAILLLPLVIAVQFVFMLGLVFILAAVQVTFRDTQYLLGLALMLGFYLSPVLYAVQSAPGRFQPVYRLNPVTILLEAGRDVLLYQRAFDPLPLAGLAFFSLLLVVLGRGIFLRSSASFAEEL